MPSNTVAVLMRGHVVESVFHTGLHGSHCLLQNKLRRWLLHGDRLSLGITGGSSTAKRLCSEEDGLFELFATHLRRAYPDQWQNLKATNSAQGNSNTLWSSLMLDSLLNTRDMDVIFWEYSINDAAFNTHENMSLYLNIWLKRVSQLPARPAVVLVYLWDSTRRDDPTKDHASEFPVSSALEAQLPVIEHYAAMGMDISVINVAAGLDKDPRSILADPQHPNCKGQKYIADVMASYIFQQALGALGSSLFAKGCLPWPDEIAPARDSSTRRSRAIETIMSSRFVYASHEIFPRSGWLPRVVRSNAKLLPMHGTKVLPGRAGGAILRCSFAQLRGTYVGPCILCSRPCSDTFVCPAGFTQTGSGQRPSRNAARASLFTRCLKRTSKLLRLRFHGLSMA